jgi:hypothetical protein
VKHVRPTDSQFASLGGTTPAEMNWKSLTVGCGAAILNAPPALGIPNNIANTATTEIMEVIFLMPDIICFSSGNSFVRLQRAYRSPLRENLRAYAAVNFELVIWHEMSTSCKNESYLFMQP